MKLKEELPFVVSLMKGKEDRIKEYREELRKAGRYNIFEIRFAWDVLRAVAPKDYICGLYHSYDCHDTHITTLAISALKQLNLL